MRRFIRVLLIALITVVLFLTIYLLIERGGLSQPFSPAPENPSIQFN
jgi:hypothetical protein